MSSSSRVVAFALMVLAGCSSGAQSGHTGVVPPDAGDDGAIEAGGDDVAEARDDVAEARDDAPSDDAARDAAAPDASPAVDAPPDRPDAADASPRVDAPVADVGLDAPVADVGLDAPVADAPPDRPDVLDDAGPRDTPAVTVDAPPDVPLTTCTGAHCAVQVSAGDTLACARLADGTVACWGSDEAGQIGDGAMGVGLQRTRPTPVRDLTDVVEVAVGNAHACARRADGSVWCWGQNSIGQLGRGTTSAAESTPGRVVGITDATQISCGAATCCAVRASGALSCWGSNIYGALGDGSTELSRALPTAVSGITTARVVAVGNRFACAGLADGRARCWGENSYGQLGIGATGNRGVPVEVSGLTGVTALTAGGFGHACALRGDGSAACWGSNTWGQIGDNTAATRQLVPAGVALPTPLRSITAGATHTCGTTTRDTVLCWGDNLHGQLGNGGLGSSRFSLRPNDARGLAPVAMVSAGTAYNCALTRAGSLVCWGRGDRGELGSGAASGYATPQAVSDLRGVAQLSAAGDRTCAVLADGTGRCWGKGIASVLSPGLTVTGIFTPVATTDLVGAQEVSLGFDHACYRLRDGTVRCTGASAYGATGGGGITTPASLATLRGVAGITLGLHSACALLDDGAVRCWGSNFGGLHGVGTSDDLAHETPAAPVMGLPPTAAIDFGLTHVCAAARDRTAWCWGVNAHGELGDGTTAQRAQAVAVAGLTGVTQVVGGAEHSCARRDDGSVWCWGHNDRGQCGADLTTAPTLLRATRVEGLGDVTSLTAGNRFTCALRGDRTVWCWGDNGAHQLGDDLSVAPRRAPSQVQGLTDVTALTAGDAHACALRADGTARCWGAFRDGQLGFGHLYAVTW